MLILTGLQVGAQDNACDDSEISKSAKKTFKKAIDDLHYGRYLEATKKLQKAVEDEPDYVEAWWVLADINSRYTNRMRKRSLARQGYEEVIRICPAYEDYYAYFYLGRIYFAAGEYKKARQMFEAFIKSDSDNIKEAHLEEAEKQAAWAKFYDEIYSHKVPFNPVKVDKVSTPQYDEYLAIITQDNEYLYFTRRMPDTRVSGFSRENNYIERFCSARKTSSSTFEIGSPLPDPFNRQPNEGGATLTIDNKHMFFTRCKYMPNRYFNCDIYESEFIDGDWEDLGPLGPEINRPDSWESMPSVSSDGKTMYFVSNRSDGSFGGLDIYVTRKGADGKWTKAVNMGPAVNTAGNEKSPFIHTDSQTLYFSSGKRTEKDGTVFYGHKGLGGYDIFYTRLDGKNSWIKPKNIGYPINSEKNDLGFFVSTDGRYGFFASNRFNKNGNWDIYSFELYKEARPQKVLLMKGVLRDEETKEVIEDASIEIKDLRTKKKISIPVDSRTGEYAFAVTFKNDYMVTVKKRDYVYVSKYISKKDVQYQVPVKIDFKLQKIKVGKPYKLEDIHFATDSDQLTPESKNIVESFYEFLIENPNIKIEIQGHTDNVGSDAYNKELSERRARTVYELLISMGVPANRMTYKGYGESMPVADNSTEEGRAKNRRTVFVITQK
jgi:outer membrane protein OmpA-like peptidoglycan-associated protein/ribosomal protein L24E